MLYHFCIFKIPQITRKTYFPVRTGAYCPTNRCIRETFKSPRFSAGFNSAESCRFWTLEIRRSSRSVYVYASRGNGSITPCVYRLITRSARLKEQPNMNCQCSKQLTYGITTNYFLCTFVVAV